MERATICTRWLAFGERVEARLDADGELQSALLVIDRRVLAAPQHGTQTNVGRLDRIAEFLVAFPARSETRVALACAVGTLQEDRAVSWEVAADAREGPTQTFGFVDEPVDGLLDVIAGERWSVQTANLRLANWRSGDEWRLEIEAFGARRFIIGRWPHEARVPWAEELWEPHPTDGDDTAARVRREVAACCVGETDAAATARALAAGVRAIADGDPLCSFVEAARTLLSRWESGELGAARALHGLATALERGSGTSWATTLRERIRAHVPIEWVPIAWAAEALTEAAAPKDRRAIARRAIVRLLIAATGAPQAHDAAAALLLELRALDEEGDALDDAQLADYLARAEQAADDYLAGSITDDELIGVLEQGHGLLADRR